MTLEKYGNAFEVYSKIVENKSVTICSKCGSDNSTNYDWMNKASCHDCGHTEWEKKFEYKTIGVFS